MKIEKTRFGTIEVPDDQLVDFPFGIIGFPDAKQFVILEHGEGSALRWLQACNRPELAFLVIDPLPLLEGYPVERLKKGAEDLGLDAAEEIAIVAVVTVPPQPAVPTVNLMAPLVMGVASRKGKQVVLHDSPYHTRHPLVFAAPEGTDEAKTGESEGRTGSGG